MARETALVLCVLLFACNGGGASGASTAGGQGTGVSSPETAASGADTAPGGPSESATAGVDPGAPTTGSSGVTAGPGTGNDETGNDEAGIDDTGDPGTGDPGASGDPVSTGGVETGAPGTGGDETSAGPGGDETSAGPGTGSSGGDVQGCVPIKCEGKQYDCGDCIDNDGDGKIDLADPECVSPCDDREDSFATGLPGDNADPCKQDCFFDGNSGAGGGDCQWNLKCDPENPGGKSCPYDPNYKNCPAGQTQTCIDICQVPNGCDCFGCCAVTVDGETHHVYLGDQDCSLATIEQCTKCSMNDDCDNPCVPEECELCFAEEELPPGCDQPTCEQGLMPCAVDDGGGSGCPEGFFCSTGCCVPVKPG